MAKKDIKKALRDFWYGKPHSAEEGGRRLGDLHEEKTHTESGAASRIPCTTFT